MSFVDVQRERFSCFLVLDVQCRCSSILRFCVVSVRSAVKRKKEKRQAKGGMGGVLAAPQRPKRVILPLLTDEGSKRTSLDHV